MPDPLAYWNSLYFSQPKLARFALNILAILFISSKCEWVFSSTKYLITDFYNRLKADIIKANKCLKSWYGCLEAKAFKQGVDPNINDLYKEEAAAKAKAKAEAVAEVAAKKDSNTQDNAD